MFHIHQSVGIAMVLTTETPTESETMMEMSWKTYMACLLSSLTYQGICSYLPRDGYAICVFVTYVGQSVCYFEILCWSVGLLLRNLSILKYAWSVGLFVCMFVRTF